MTSNNNNNTTNPTNMNPCMYCSNYGMDFNMDAYNMALKLMVEAVQDERSDELSYDYLIKNAPTQEDKEIIESIRNDEKNHRTWFREIYKAYTNEDIEVNESKEFILPSSYLDGIRRAVFGELDAMEKYRIIREGIPNRYSRDVILRILTDEMKHATKYNYLLNRYAISQYIPKVFREIE